LENDSTGYGHVSIFYLSLALRVYCVHAMQEEEEEVIHNFQVDNFQLVL